MTKPILRLKNISKSFGALKASDDISLDLFDGEILALIGPNGAGKSTLIKQIAGGLAPDSGLIEFLGKDVTKLNTIDRARMGLGRSFQVSAIIPEYSVLENIMLAVYGREGGVYNFFTPWKKKEYIAEAESYAERTNLGNRLHIIANELAHGEKRRLELSMALAIKPKALLLDEPMAGMGAEGAVEVTSLLNALKQEVPILLVEHDMDAVFKLADRISVLVYGAIIATDTVENIRINPDVRKAYLGEEVA